MRYTVIRSKRRSVSLSVTRQAEVVVRAPARLPLPEIHRFVSGRAEWVSCHLQKAQRRLELERLPYVPGRRLRYLGQEVVLTASEGYASRARLEGESLLVPRIRLPQARRLVWAWYRARAREVLGETVSRFAPQMGAWPKRVSLKDTVSRWGSCSASGNLGFSWRLVMAPPWVVDYVVVHELAHLSYLNHSAAFWHHVARHCPDFGRAQAWLREQGEDLVL